VFAYVRKLRARPELAARKVQTLKPLAYLWHQSCPPEGRGPSPEDDWHLFAEAWHQVEQPEGQGPLDALFAASVTQPLPRILQEESTQLQRLAQLCAALQEQKNLEPFFLGCVQVGQLFGTHWSTANRWLAVLQSLGVLCLVRRGNKMSGRASEYYYIKAGHD
jgi:hypothetical protein